MQENVEGAEAEVEAEAGGEEEDEVNNEKKGAGTAEKRDIGIVIVLRDRELRWWDTIKWTDLPLGGRRRPAK